MKFLKKDFSLNKKALRVTQLKVICSRKISFSKIKFYWIKNNKLFFSINCHKQVPKLKEEHGLYIYEIQVDEYDFPQIWDIKVKFKEQGAFKGFKIFELYYSQFFEEELPMVVRKEEMKIDGKMNHLEVQIRH